MFELPCAEEELLDPTRFASVPILQSSVAASISLISLGSDF